MICTIISTYLEIPIFKCIESQKTRAAYIRVCGLKLLSAFNFPFIEIYINSDIHIHCIVGIVYGSIISNCFKT